MIDVLFHPVREAIGAVSRRLGTVFSTFLVTQWNVPTELAGQLLLALGAVGGVSIDIALALYSRHKMKRAALVAAEAKVALRQHREQAGIAGYTMADHPQADQVL